MKKLYIPTCTLNLNTILATESVSPPIFYSERKFGIKRFEKIQANDIDHLIVLYSALPSYDLQDQGLDNYPMIIEIEIDAASLKHWGKITDGVEVYTSSSTIYLSPASTIIRVDKEAFTIIQSRAEQSGENKLFTLYHEASCFRGIQANGPRFELTTSYTEKVRKKLCASDQAEYDKNELEKDHIIDRLKGFAYCYLIGANSSVSKELAELRVLAKNMKNALSAIINSPERKPTDAEDERLLKDIKQFNAIFQLIELEKADPKVAKKFSNLIKKFEIRKENLWEILEELDLKKHLFSKVDGPPIYDALELYSCIGCSTAKILDEYHRVISELDKVIENIGKDQEQTKIKAKPAEIFSVNAKEARVDILDKTFPLERYNDFINALIKNKQKDEQKKENHPESLTIAVMCGKLVKEHFAGKWEGSSTQTYINGLFASLQGSSDPFDIHSIDRDELKALAAFTQKGSDIDKLSAYLLSCGFCDYRLAYGLYGATKGFATLPKTFTNVLLAKKDEYTRSVHKYIYDECSKILKAYQPESPCKESKITPENEITPCNSNNDVLQETQSGEKAAPPPVQAESVAKDEKAGSPLDNNLESSLRDHLNKVEKFREIAGKNQEKIIKALMPIYKDVIDSDLVKEMEKMEKLGEPKNATVAWKECRKYFESLEKEKQDPQRKVCEQRSYQLSFSTSGATRARPPFVEDPEARQIVDNFLCERNVNAQLREKIVKNLEFLLEGYQPGGRYYENEKENPRDNASVIGHFYKLCFSDKTPERHRLDANPQNRELLERLREHLKEKYPA